MHIPFDIPTALVTTVALPVLYVTLRRIRRFAQEHVDLALNAVFWVLSRVFVQSLATRVSLKRYARNQLQDAATRYLVVPGKDSVSLETDSIFVPLKLESGTADALMLRPQHIGTAGNRVRIVGDPGSGKSSLVKNLMREACRGIDALPVTFQRGWGRPQLPIMVELKRFCPPEALSQTDEEAGKWAIAELGDMVGSIRGFEMGTLFESYATGRGLLVLLDGLDEVSGEAYERTAKAIRGLSRELARLSERNGIILTMRSQFHQQVRYDFDDEFPPVFHIAPFSPEHIFRFLENWPFKDTRLENIARIYATLTDRPTLREMCRNPLVLAMYVASDQSSQERSVADTRTLFYDQVVEELLVARRSRQLGVSARVALREQRETLLGRLALENLTDSRQPANLIAWRTAVGHAQDVLNCPSETVAEERLRLLAKDTGVFAEEREGESLRFIHLTFCEFLAAKEAAQGREDGWSDLLNQHRAFRASSQAQMRARLNEVIPFAVALLPRSARPDAVREVAAFDDAEVLGRCLLETQAYGQSDVWDVYMNAEQSAVLDVEPSQWDGDWLQRLHLFSVVLRDAEDWARLAHRQFGVSLEMVVHDLVGTDRARLVKVFEAYALTDPGAAFRLAEACGVDMTSEAPELVIRSSGFPPFLTIAMQRATADASTRDRWAALLAEAALRNNYVAWSMASQSAPPALRSAVNALPAAVRWSVRGVDHQRRGVRPGVSFYDAFLTLATSHRDDSGPALRAVDIVRRIRPPGLGAAPWRWRLGACVAGPTGAVVVWAAARAGNPAPVEVAVVLSAMGFCALAIPLWRFPGYERARYAEIANLHWGRRFYRRTAGRRHRVSTLTRAVYRTEEFAERVLVRSLYDALTELATLRERDVLIDDPVLIGNPDDVVEAG